ncbi:hypothetical protein D1007_54309 [Hordeum vulgare]|nr:hypothetical protein D1007_54309 [Hordeum vulgare]
MDKGSSGSDSATADMEAMAEELGLNEDNMQDVVVSDVDLPAEATRWMAMARVHTDKPYRQYWFYRNMSVVWDLTKEVKIRPLKDNVYNMQFMGLGDWERVMEDGPSTYKGKAVMLAPYDGLIRLSTTTFEEVEI